MVASSGRVWRREGILILGDDAERGIRYLILSSVLHGGNKLVCVVYLL